jgi:hypothetical protein
MAYGSADYIAVSQLYPGEVKLCLVSREGGAHAAQQVKFSIRLKVHSLSSSPTAVTVR